jgi:hypothetical protein
MSDNVDKVSFLETFTTLFRRLSCEEINTSFPAVIEAYDYKTQRADVRIMSQRVYSDGSTIPMPVISSVPVMMPRTASAMIKMPVAVGDTVLVIVSKASLDEWVNGGEKAQIRPSQQFRLMDAVAIVGLFPFSNENDASDDDSLEIINSGQKIVVKKNGDIEIGGSNLKEVVTADILSILTSHVHLSNGAVSAELAVLTPYKTRTVVE